MNLSSPSPQLQEVKDILNHAKQNSLPASKTSSTPPTTPSAETVIAPRGEDGFDGFSQQLELAVKTPPPLSSDWDIAIPDKRPLSANSIGTIPIVMSLASSVANQHANIVDDRLFTTRLTFANGNCLTALIDSGCTEVIAVRKSFRDAGFTESPLPEALPMIVADGSLIPNAVTHGGVLKASVPSAGLHFSTPVALVDSASYDIILGLPWIKRFWSFLDWTTCKLVPGGASNRHAMVGTHSLAVATPLPTDDGPTPAHVTVVNDTDESPQELFPDLDAAVDLPAYIEKLKTIIPKVYHDLLAAFSKAKAEGLPPSRGVYDHRIEVPPDTIPHAERLRHTAQWKLVSQRLWIQDMLNRGLIRRSTSPWAANLTSAPKTDDQGRPTGELRWCVDYTGLNVLVKANRTPIPLVQESLDMLARAVIYTKLDIRSAFNQVLNAPGTSEFTAFLCREGLFETVVMPFGLKNAPATWQALINYALRGLRDVICLVYVDDIIIFSEKREEHEGHVRQVLQALIDANLYVKAEKSEFSKESVTFLGQVISNKGINMCPTRTAAISAFPMPTNTKEVQSFLGLVNAYRRFVPNFASIALPLNALTTKAARDNFVMTDGARRSVQLLKDALASAPVLRHFLPELPTRVETDASAFAIAAVLTQEHEDGWHPVAYHSRKMNQAESRYHTPDQELLAIVAAVRQWRPYLESCHTPFTILSDQQSLQHFQKAQKLSVRHLRWSQDINAYPYEIKYRPGKENGKADALSRNPDWDTGPKKEDGVVIRPVTAYHLQLVKCMLSLCTSTDIVAPIVRPVTAAYSRTIRELSNRIAAETETDTDLVEPLPKAFSGTRSKLLFNGKRYVPASLRAEVLVIAHDDPTAGHPGREKTLDLVRRQYMWPGMHTDVAAYCASCDACQRSKPSRQKPAGEYKPLPIPDGPWDSVSWDYVGPLPKSEGHDAIFVIVDRFTKFAQFIPANTTDTSRSLAEMYDKHVFQRGGHPTSIVSDRGSIWNSGWWLEHCKMTGVDMKLSTAFHPQTNGQTERTHQSMEHMLRCYVDHNQTDWVQWLSSAQFAYNNSWQATIRQSPFMALNGKNARDNLEVSAAGTKEPTAVDYVQQRHDARERARLGIQAAIDRMEALSATRRSKAPEYAEGDMVLLTTEHLKEHRAVHKLSDKFCGPFRVTKVDGNNVTLDLDLAGLGVYNVFHVDKVKPYVDPASFPGRPVYKRPPPVLDDPDNVQWEVEKIHDSRVSNRQVQYFVTWKGWGRQHQQWVSWDNFDADDQLVLDFKEEHPDKVTHGERELSKDKDGNQSRRKSSRKRTSPKTR